MLVWGRHAKAALLGLALTFAQAQTKAPPVDTLRLATLLEHANSLESKQPQEALALATEGIALAAKEGDKEKEAAFLSTASFACIQIGSFPMAVEYGKRALVLGTEIGNKERIAKAHNLLGITFTYLGLYSQALEEGFEALHLREALGKEEAISQSLNLIGVIYHHSGQYEKAIGYFNQILKRVETRPDPKRLILAKHNIGFAQFKLGRLPEALQNHQEALALSKEFRETAYVPYAYLNLGLTYSELRKFDKADEYLRLAQTEYRKVNQQHGLAQVLLAMARMHLLTGAVSRGIPLAKEGAELAKKIHARNELRLGYELISDLYEKGGNLAESYRYYKMADAAKESIASATESQKIAEAAMKFVTLKKDNEIKALKMEQVISALKIEKQRYSSVIFIASTCFLVAFVLVLGTYNKKMRLHRALLEQSNADLALSNSALQDRMNEIKTLSGLLPICAQCKKIRNDKGYWTQLEGYISAHSAATFTHSICPHCADELYPGVRERIQAKAGSPPPNQSA